MDHIPSPKNNRLNLPKVPYISCPSKAGYDVDEDGQARMRLHFDREDRDWRGFIERGQVPEAMREWQPSEILAWIQQWAYFCFLENLFTTHGIKFDANDMVVACQDGSSHQISTILLPHYLGLLQHHNRRLQNHKQKESIQEFWSNDFLELKDFCIEVGLDAGPGEQCLLNVLSPGRHSQEGGAIRSEADLVFLSINILVHSLIHVRNSLIDAPPKSDDEELLQPQLRIVKELLYHAGWCPYENSTIKYKATDLAESVFLAQVDRSQLKEGHRRCWANVTVHNDMLDASKCSINHIDNETYQPSHAVAGCECNAVTLETVDGMDVENIVESRRVPLVAMPDFGNLDGSQPRCTAGSIDLLSLQDDGQAQAVKSGEDLEGEEDPKNSVGNAKGQEASDYRAHRKPHPAYVAISHVWADGLGNLQSNTLPACQLRRIQALVNNLFEGESRNIPFWIDTVCIPRNPRNPCTRTDAIKSIRDIFAQAHKVLVLDSSLLDLAADCSHEELAVMIKHSSWMRRMWTFTEGASAQDVHFQFQDKSLNARSIMSDRAADDHEGRTHDFWRDNDEKSKNVLETCERDGFVTGVPQHAGTILADQLRPFIATDETLASAHPSLRKCSGVRLHETGVQELEVVIDGFAHVRRDKLGPLEFQAVCDAFRWRTTSWPSDELFCIYQLLGWDIHELVDEPHATQTRRFFSKFQAIDAGILFADIERFEEDGIRWMPKSILGIGSYPYLSRTATITSAGLTVILNGARIYLIDLPDTRRGEFVGVFADTSGLRFGVTCASSTFKPSRELTQYDEFVVILDTLDYPPPGPNEPLLRSGLLARILGDTGYATAVAIELGVVVTFDPPENYLQDNAADQFCLNRWLLR